MAEKGSKELSGVIDDLCHVLGVQKKNVWAIRIAPGIVRVYTKDGLECHTYHVSFE